MATRPKILVIDDVSANLMPLGAALEDEYDIQVATSGSMGLEVAREEQPDLILLDATISGIDGFEICRRMKADFMLRRIPLIFVTAGDEAATASAGLELGAADYLTKPINVAIARQRIRHLIERENLRKALEDRELHLEKLVRRRTAELEQTIMDLEFFLYSASHDLRTPLRAINGFAKILRNSECEHLSAEGKELFDRIADNASQLGNLIDDILDFAKMSRQPMTTGVVAFGKLVAAVAAEFAARFPATQIQIEALPDVEGDPAMLRRVVWQLLDNAFKFSARAEQPAVTVGVRETLAAPAFFVADNGVGFDMQYAGRLFEIFQRLHRETDFPGRGAGLAKAKRLVERHGGQIWIESAPGAGATIYFTLAHPD